MECAPSLDSIHSLEYGVRKATALKAALELDIFTLIQRGSSTVSEVAAAASCSERGTRILLDALCGLGLLTKRKGVYTLTPSSEAFLVRGKPSYYGDWVLKAEFAWEVRARVKEGIKSGEAVWQDASKRDFGELWASYSAPLLVMWPQMAEKIREMWKKLDIKTAGVRILDAACGSGIKSFVLARDDPTVLVEAVDFQKVLEVAAKIAEAMGVEEQVAFCEGDLSECDFGDEKFDIVLFGAVLHFFDAEQLKNIFKKTYRALKPGGFVVINTPLADEERCHSEMALILALELLLFAPGSEVYTFSEYKKFLEREGFTTVVEHTDFLMTARK